MVMVRRSKILAFPSSSAIIVAARAARGEAVVYWEDCAVYHEVVVYPNEREKNKGGSDSPKVSPLASSGRL